MFRKYFFIIGLVIFLLLLLIIYFETYYWKTNIYSPLPINKCPDYWVYNRQKKMCIIPKYGSKNTGKLYDDTTKQLNMNLFPKNVVIKDAEDYLIDFENDNWLFWNSLGKKTSLCILKKWCNENNIYWSGISNYSGCN